MLATITNLGTKIQHPYYYYLNRWCDGGKEVERQFTVERHGNATSSHASAYYRKDPTTFSAIDKEIKTGSSADEIYLKLNREPQQTVSQTLHNPKVVHNRQYLLKKKTLVSATENHEVEKLVRMVKSESMVKGLIFGEDYYSTVNIMPHMLSDLKRFCADGDGIFTVDTTFQLADELWLTDSTYPNLSLLDEDGKHPEFPGPSQWHFRKNRESYRRFMGELTLASPELRHMKKFGHDLDVAICDGINNVFLGAEHLWCTQHLQKADAHKLSKMGCNRRTADRMMADIYGTQNGPVLEFGLADAVDADDLHVKLLSLKDVWDELVPDFHAWFLKRRLTTLNECLVLSAREEKGISGRYYSNGLELKHRLQKKN